jgi:hypothetical protein
MTGSARPPQRSVLRAFAQPMPRPYRLGFATEARIAGLFRLESSKVGPQGARILARQVTLPCRNQAPGASAMSLKAFLLEQASSPKLS